MNAKITKYGPGNFVATLPGNVNGFGDTRPEAIACAQEMFEERLVMLLAMNPGQLAPVMRKNLEAMKAAALAMKIP